MSRFALTSDPADPGKKESCGSGGPHQSHTKPDLSRFGSCFSFVGRSHVLLAGGDVSRGLWFGDRGGVGAVGILRGLVRRGTAVIAGALRLGGRTPGLARLRTGG